MDINKDTIWCVIPVYNNSATVKVVALACQRMVENVLVVDDGSTDADLSGLFQGTGIFVLRHPCNLGKGRAILSAFEHVSSKGGRFMITLDADGQHYPQDLEKFLPLLDESVLVVGCRDFSCENVPAKSRFGRRFSNLWFKLETGRDCTDTQSGFRVYPVKYLSCLRLAGRRYDFETEVLTRGVWAGLTIKEVPIKVWYPPAGQGRSSFRPIADNLRISLMHCGLVLRSLAPWPHKRLIPAPKTAWAEFCSNPRAFMKSLLSENASPSGLAASAFAGVLLGVLPLISFHTLAILYVTSRLHLNKIMALAIQNICMPPFVPVACVELGYYMRHGRWLTHLSWSSVFGHIPARLYDWLIGSLVIAPVLAAVCAGLVYVVAAWMRSKAKKYAA